MDDTAQLRAPSRRRFLALGAGLTGAIASLAACSPGAAPSPAAPKPTAPTTAKPTAPAAPAAAPTTAPAPPKPAATAAPAAKQLVKWRFGTVQAKADGAFRFMAQEKGFFREAGFDVEIVQAPSDVQLRQATIAGDMHSGEFFPIATFGAIEKGGDIRQVGAFVDRIHMMLYTVKSISAFEDLYGKSVATSAPGSLPHILVLAALHKRNQPADAIQFVTMGAEADRVKALVAGTVQATPSSFEFQQTMDPSLKVLTNFREELPYLFRGYAINGKVLKERRDEARRFTVAFGRGVRHAMENRQDAYALAEKLTGEKPDVVKWVVDYYVDTPGMLNPDFIIDDDRLLQTQQLGVDLGFQGKPLPVDQIADQPFAREVLRDLGGEFRKR